MSNLPERLPHTLQITPIGVAAASAAPAGDASLSQYLQSVPSVGGSASPLGRLLLALADASAEIALILRGMHVAKTQTSNDFGDVQLNVDLATNEAVLKHLRASGVCATASSEEEPTRIDLSSSLKVAGDQCFSVGFDPLDGSSIIDANFSVGSIFSVFPGRELIGQRVSDQRACAITQYGPRTSIIFALPPNIVFEATLDLDGRSWSVTRRDIRIAPETKTFAPANLRCTTEDEAYRRLVHYYIDNKYTLRYSGGLVPDFYHVLTKGHGIFLSPVSQSNKAKLRLVYECSCLALLSLCAGGDAVNQHGQEMAGQTLTDYDVRSGLVIGSKKEVERYKQFRQP